MKVAAIIPARAGSKRLPEKNIQEVCGKPLVAHVINAAGGAIGYKNVYVSTESDKIAKISEKYRAKIIKRPEKLAADNVFTEPVIRHAVSEIEVTMGRLDIVIWLNASIPEITPSDIKEAMQKLQEHNLWEVFTMDDNGICNSAVRIIDRNVFDRHGLSAHCGIIKRNYMDIHYKEDLAKVEDRIKERG